MFTALFVLFLIFGLIIGSFLNVVIFRIDDLKSILSTRSHCPECKKILKWYDLFPFISFFILRAKCRYCKKPISWQYPVVEIATGLLFAFTYMFFGLTFATAFYLAIFSILTVVLIHDLKTQYVPEGFVWIALFLALAGSWYFTGYGFSSMILGGIIGGGFLALLVYASKETWMGKGDIKLGVILGLIAGYPLVFFALFLSFLLGSIAGLIYIKIANKSLKDSLPFTPFLIIATYLTLVFGSSAISWYLNLFTYRY